MLLWRIRKVFQAYSREYEIIVYDDASSDETADLLRPYEEVAPLTVLRGEGRIGYGKAVELLVRATARRTRYPRRDGLIFMQGDFTDQPEHLPELIKRFEGGADIVLSERTDAQQPAEVRRFRQLAPWALRLSLPVSGVADPCASFRLYRISLLRDLVKSSGEQPILTSDGCAATLQLLMKTLPLARRVDSVALASRYDLRMRRSRVRPFADALSLYRFGRSSRGQRVSVPVPAPPAKPAGRPQPATS